jgi:cellobiose phosphorylase
MKKKQIHKKWRFVDDKGTFVWQNPHTLNQLYFPICNEAGLMASVTPTLNGDSKTSQHTFLLLPVSVEDLHNNRSARNFWIYSKKLGAYSLTGNSARQNADRFTSRDTVDMTIKGEMLAHHLIREDKKTGIRSEIIDFCPVNDDAAELMWVKITNISKRPLEFTATSAVPIFGRSAENIRDHKHATSLIHRQKTFKNGVVVTPVIYHDESGHKPNDTSYYVCAVDGSGKDPAGQFPTVMEFIGEGGGFDQPEAVIRNIPPYKKAPNRRDGMESMGALRFAKTVLRPGKTKEYIVMMGIAEDQKAPLKALKRYGGSRKIKKALEDNRRFWQERTSRIAFSGADPDFGNWMHWIALQPVLRKIYGCSFLPHHDYGKGGRGWRDLWQDCLALLLQDPKEVRDVLIGNFSGVRTDGTNATIIRKGLGQFAADRNSISRVWMDHGVWPFFTTKMYIDQTGDIGILLEQAPYWRDHQIWRAKRKDEAWRPSDGNRVRTPAGDDHRGSLIEHILIQHLTCFLNVGSHNNIKLEDGDWNDQLDMAPDKGETVPFSAFYGGNLIRFAELLLELGKRRDVREVVLSKEVLALTDIEKTPLDLDSPADKQTRLSQYLQSVEKGMSGKSARVSIERLAEDLRHKGEWMIRHVRTQEWIDSRKGCGFFNGYYNNDGERVDGDHPDGTRMNLTAQTFACLSGAATDEQVKKSFEAARKILKDPNTGGFRLTTPLGPNTFNLGRGFALVYGEKETGAMFSHMAVMFTNALYERGFIREGFEVFSSIYRLCSDTPKAKIYPGIPEYITHEGRGMYHYLTGSGSWMFMTVLTQIFGVKGRLGDLLIRPKLVKEQFDKKGRARVSALFAGKRIEVTYSNPALLDHRDYTIKKVLINGKAVSLPGIGSKEICIRRKEIEKVLPKPVNDLEIVFG